MKITIPFKTPTINHLYWHKGNMKIKTTEARRLQEKIEEIVEKDGNNKVNVINAVCPSNTLKVTTEIYENWYCKNGSVYVKDVANREKFLIDCVFRALGINDCYIFEHHIRKIQSTTEEKAEITIEVL